MPRGAVPDVYADGRWRSAGEIDAAARAWRVAVLDALGDRPRVVATALPASPEGVALFAALTSLPFPPVLLSPDASAWPATPLPPGTAIVLLPSLAGLAAAAKARGWGVTVLPEHHDGRAPDVAPLSGPGVVTFTSGSTGAPKPVFRPLPALLPGIADRCAALGIAEGDGIIVGVTLVHGQGMNMMIAAMLLGGPLGFLPPVNHRAALATLAMPAFRCWRATPHFADVLGRCALAGPAVAPPICVISSPVTQGVFDAFRERFGVPLRQSYASSETGPIALDHRPAADVRPGTVGWPLPRVEVSIGDAPGRTLPAGEAGRIWVRSPFLMGGYGFPPELERPGMLDGWWPTRDLGRCQADGQLALAGRMDDCIRTRDGRLVNLAAIADIIRALASVRGVAVVPLRGSAGASFGAVVECDARVAPAAFRSRLSDALPPWARPRKVAVVSALPTLANGKPDRTACLAALGEQAP
ncbi:MAG TPA: fatty acid--CoA ligase family protein [Vicinamibacterales bacterium]|nr:fatty acid--CoA ligase family protein [Vicinamibacterales bacterium]